jgi:Uma2 family endonuclease
MKTAIDVDRPRRFRWTVADYDFATNKGVFRDRRMELINGRIIEMAAQHEPHLAGVSLAIGVLTSAFGSGFYIRPPGSLRQGRYSKPEPDVAVVPGTARDCAKRGTPSTALLVVEISDSSLSYDCGEKASLYAKNGIADYWIVNLVDRQLEIYRDPIPDPTHRYRYRYASVQILKARDTITPLAAPHAVISVADLLL